MTTLRYRVEVFFGGSTTIHVLDENKKPISFIDGLKIAERESLKGWPALIIAFNPGENDLGHIAFVAGKRAGEPWGQVRPVDFLEVIENKKED